MRTSLLPLYILIGILAVAVAWLWTERERGTGSITSAHPVHAPVGESSTADSAQDREPRSTNPEVDRRLTEIAKRLDDLSGEVEQLKTSTSRSPIAAPPPSEAEFVDRHRATIVQVVDEETRKREWTKAVKEAQDIAGGMAGRFGLHESTTPRLREFGLEYMRRAGVIIEENRGDKVAKVQDVNSPEYAQWEREWQTLHEWARGQLADIDGAHAKEMWGWFSSLEGGLYLRFMP